MKKKIISILAGVTIISSITGCSIHQSSTQSEQTQASNVTVKKGNLQAYVSGTGAIATINRATLTAGKTGTVSEVLFAAGQQVKKGDTLVTFKPTDVSSELSQQNYNLKKANLELASLENEAKTSDDTKVDDQIAQKKLEIESIQNQIASINEKGAAPDPIVSSIDGEIATKTVSPGDELMNDTSLGEIVNYTDLQIVLKIDELDISKIKKDQTVDISVDAFPNKTFKGTVTEVAKEGTSTNGVSTFDVKVVLDKTDGLLAGMSASANILVEDKKDVLYLPVEAIQERRGKSYVTLNSDTKEQVEVTVGINNENQIEIVKGLKEGQEVLIPTVKTSSTKQTNMKGMMPGSEGMGQGSGMGNRGGQ